VPWGPAYSERTAWNGPAHSAARYVGSGGVSGNTHRASPGPTAVGSGVVQLETSSYPAGAITSHVNRALRSGCSKQANTRRASAAAHCV